MSFDANNWDNGLPTSSKVAVFNGALISGATFDSTVQAANRVVAGLKTENNWTATLSLTGGNSLTVSSLINDTSTGFKWASGDISQASSSDVLIIAGAGDGDNNAWSGGSISNMMALSNIYVNDYSTLRITASANTLGSNIIIGQDGHGGSTLEFLNQSATLFVTNNAYIKVSDTSDDIGPNQILFSTDVTQGGTATKGLSTTSTDSFIDNFGTITRSNAGMYQIDLPIKNSTSSLYPTLLDLQSSLWISGKSLNKTANNQQFPAAGNTASFSGSLRVGVRNRFRHDNSLASLFCRAQRDLPWMPT
ncbi:MAG: hypothetical protein HYX68_13255, partial [Planctomycetes bacterium]|nr:hypothetical protein [Planctomycetota bacterium]